MAEKEIDPIFLSLGKIVKKSIKSRGSVMNGKKVEFFKGKDLVICLSKLKKISSNHTERDFKTMKQISDFGEE